MIVDRVHHLIIVLALSFEFPETTSGVFRCLFWRLLSGRDKFIRFRFFHKLRTEAHNFLRGLNRRALSRKGWWPPILLSTNFNWRLIWGLFQLLGLCCLYLSLICEINFGCYSCGYNLFWGRRTFDIDYFLSLRAVLKRILIFYRDLFGFGVDRLVLLYRRFHPLLASGIRLTFYFLEHFFLISWLGWLFKNGRSDLFSF